MPYLFSVYFHHAPAPSLNKGLPRHSLKFGAYPARNPYVVGYTRVRVSLKREMTTACGREHNRANPPTLWHYDLRRSSENDVLWAFWKVIQRFRLAAEIEFFQKNNSLTYNTPIIGLYFLINTHRSSMSEKCFLFHHIVICEHTNRKYGWQPHKKSFTCIIIFQKCLNKFHSV